MEKKQEEKNNKELIIGIDDAGRGPVIGPMVLAGVLVRKEVETELRRAGIKDSKLLTAKTRDELVKTIKEMILDFHYQIITPAEIDTGFGMGVNLNEVEAIAAANIVNHLCKNLNEEQKKNLVIVIDCPSNNPSSWLNTLMKYIKKENQTIRIRAEHKADFHYPSVSAASIIAKTTRDGEIEKIKEQIGLDFGSGYPADPTTKEFLAKHSQEFKKERIFRESWATWQTATGKLEENKKSKQSKLFE